MDELELLKKDWKKTDSTYRQKSSSDIYSMLQSKSSSIVKTLLLISIAELLFWIVMNLLPLFSSKEYRERLDTIYGNEITFTILTIASIAIIVVFVYLLFTNYKRISVTDTSKKLMENILNTRRVVKYFVICNLILFFITLVYTFYYTIANDPRLSSMLDIGHKSELTGIIVKFAIATAIILSILWLIYKLIYGRLVKRLNVNYKELKKLEN